MKPTRSLSRRRLLGSLAATGLPFAVPIAARGADDQSYTLRMNIPTAAGSLYALIGLRLAANVARRTNGRLKIEVYPSGQLANEREMLSELNSGVIDLTISTTPLYVPISPLFQIFDVPFLFKDLAAGYRVLDSSVGDELFASLEPKGIVGLSWITNGFKQLETTNKAVTVPADMKGLRIRTQTSPVYIAAYQALGAIPTAIDIQETYVALNTKTLDGIDLSLDSFLAGKFNVIVKHVAIVNSIFNVLPLMASKRKVDALPPPLKQALKDESKALVRYARTLAAQKELEALRAIKDGGITINGVQHDLFRKAMDPVYALVQTRIGAEIVDRVSRIVNAG